mmetsp:Transcript_44740/g.97209  ORF Transcript_44740/g.97209 Transcript_44740/m.97209 type:complete len:221 (-) Transcript_44740:51-713(-)
MKSATLSGIGSCDLVLAISGCRKALLKRFKHLDRTRRSACRSCRRPSKVFSATASRTQASQSGSSAEKAIRNVQVKLPSSSKALWTLWSGSKASSWALNSSSMMIPEAPSACTKAAAINARTSVPCRPLNCARRVKCTTCRGSSASSSAQAPASARPSSASNSTMCGVPYAVGVLGHRRSARRAKRTSASRSFNRSKRSWSFESSRPTLCFSASRSHTSP